MSSIQYLIFRITYDSRHSIRNIQDAFTNRILF